jgi:DNA-binding MarR family transcriptional regulator
MDHTQHIGYEIHTLEKLIRPRLNTLLENQNVTKMQSWIIRYLYDRQDEAVYQKDLEAFFHIARSTATGILQGMEKQGFLIRCSVESDARLKRIVLTEKGAKLQMAVLHTINQNEEALRKGISEEDLSTFFRVIEQMQKNAQDIRDLCPDSEEIPE